MSKPSLNNGLTEKVMIGTGIIPVVWIGAIIAPAFYANNAVRCVAIMMERLNSPFEFVWCGNLTIKVIGAVLLIYAMAIAWYYSNKKNTRRGEEYGSAAWANPMDIAKKITAKNKEKNFIISQNCSIAYEYKKHRLNNNVIVLGGSGTGKTRGYVMPNLLNADGTYNYFVIDTKGEISKNCGKYLESKGYEVKVFNILEMDKSNHYNPFCYLKNDNDIETLVNNFYSATTPKGASSSDPFWDKAAMMLMKAIVSYLFYEGDEDDKNFATVMDMLRAAALQDEDDTETPLDIIFNELAERDPEHQALKYYRNYRQGGGKTLQGIQITLASRLEKFNLESVANLTLYDDLELEDFGNKKMVIFGVVPDSDTSYNFLISMMYQQMFQTLERVADKTKGGRLKHPVHFFLDEFANTHMADNFETVLATCRSRGFGMSIILQSIAQLKVLYKEGAHEGIMGNCDITLYLGGNEPSSFEYVSKRLGKETIATNTYGKSSGSHGSYSTNDQQQGRELMTPEEVGEMDNANCIVFVRGMKPLFDLKYELTRHPHIKEAGFEDKTKLFNFEPPQAVQLLEDKIEENRAIDVTGDEVFNPEYKEIFIYGDIDDMDLEFVDASVERAVDDVYRGSVA